jgi:hypothetical protein
VSTGLLQQLADYGAFHDEEQGYIDVDDVFAAGTSVSPSDASVYVAPRRSSWFGVWVAIAALVLTVLLIGVIPFLVNNDGTPPADTVVATTLAESAPTTLGESVPITGTWFRVPQDESVFGGGDMKSVTVGGPGLVAVGDEGSNIAVWTSVDGVTWSRVPHDETVFGQGHMSSVTVGGPGLVAVGADGEGAAVWTSVDGIVWSRVPHDEAVFGGAVMNSVTVGGPGLVAVGTGDPWGDRDDNPDWNSDAAVWTSVDGISWSRVPHDATVFGGGDNQMMHDVTAGGPGLVAVGYSGTHGWDNPTGRPAVWTSVDGLVWSRVSDEPSVFGGRSAMLSVTVGGPGLVAVGYDPFGCRPVWTSVDGIAWSPVPSDVPGACRPLLDVVATEAGLVAVGRKAESWTSVDGITWTQIPGDQTSLGSNFPVMKSVTQTDSGLVAVGDIEFEQLSKNWNAAVWLWTD